jgi:hypothetical protein
MAAIGPRNCSTLGPNQQMFALDKTAKAASGASYVTGEDRLPRRKRTPRCLIGLTNVFVKFFLRQDRVDV